MIVPSHDPAGGRLAVIYAGRRQDLAGLSGFSPVYCESEWEAISCLRQREASVVLACLPLPEWPPDELLEHIQRESASTPCVFLNLGANSLAEGLRLVKLGAFDYAVSVDGVQAALARAFEQAHGAAAASPDDEPWRRFLVGESTPMRVIGETIRLVARRRSTVLITGETGTGKEMAARAIHAASNRSHLPMVSVNCGALPENLLEAELFGHVKGAFTGAVQNRVGRFEQARDGTIFLDEIAEMPLDLQSKLLRVLQEREFQRLGSSETLKVDVRVIAAANVDLESRIRQGRFREDLYYRLNVVPLRMPALRERASDIPLLVRHFLDKVCRLEDIPVKKIAAETIDRLVRYRWPGNVRQLENAVEMAVALAGERDVLYAGDFPLPMDLPAPSSVEAFSSVISVPDEGLDFEATVSSIERRLLEQALRKTNGNKTMAAELLRLKRTTLAAKLRSLEMAAGRP